MDDEAWAARKEENERALAAFKEMTEGRPFKLICTRHDNLPLTFEIRYVPETDLEIKPTQHCTSEECGYTFSHTAEYCGRPQKRRCGCPWCYSKED